MVLLIALELEQTFRLSVLLEKCFIYFQLDFCRMAASSSTPKLSKLTLDQWRQRLTPEQFRVLRLKATEPPGTGRYNAMKDRGIYVCGGCEAPLYRSDTKFDSGCGWPAFYEGLPGAVKEVPDADGHRVEIVCNQCEGHLGHVFKGEGFPTPTDARHCVNSASLHFNPQ